MMFIVTYKWYYYHIRPGRKTDLVGTLNLVVRPGVRLLCRMEDHYEFCYALNHQLQGLSTDMQVRVLLVVPSTSLETTSL